MAVPAHDERDYEFAKKFGIDIVPVIEQITGEVKENEKHKESIVAVLYDEKQDKYLTINWGDLGGRLFVGGTRHDNESAIDCAIREIKEETGYTDFEFVREIFPINHHYYAYNKNQAYEINSTGLLFKLTSDATQEVNLDDDEKDNFKVEWVDEKTIRIPMLPTLRSLNLSNSVAIITYEILRQHNFEDLQETSTYFKK